MHKPTPNLTGRNENRLRFAIVGAGFWAQFQLAAWTELADAECVAIVDHDLERAQQLAHRFEIPQATQSIEQLCNQTELDFVDIVSCPQSHVQLIAEASASGVRGVICQKPLVEDFTEAKRIVQQCDEQDTQLNVHENWRWQTPIRALKKILGENPIGKIHRARVAYNNSFPVFDNQPGLKQLERFILLDMGTHIFDTCRFLFGDPSRIYCQTSRSRDDIQGEDVASTIMHMTDGMTLLCEISYASRLECDRFPETFVSIEGDSGAIELSADYVISVTTPDGTHRRRYAPPYYPWADARYGLVHSSMVDCNRNLLQSFIDHVPAETAASDNLNTLAIIDAAYRSAHEKSVIELSSNKR